MGSNKRKRKSQGKKSKGKMKIEEVEVSVVPENTLKGGVRKKRGQRNTIDGKELNTILEKNLKSEESTVPSETTRSSARLLSKKALEVVKSVTKPVVFDDKIKADLKAKKSKKGNIIKIKQECPDPADIDEAESEDSLDDFLFKIPGSDTQEGPESRLVISLESQGTETSDRDPEPAVQELVIDESTEQLKTDKNTMKSPIISPSMALPTRRGRKPKPKLKDDERLDSSAQKTGKRKYTRKNANKKGTVSKSPRKGRGSSNKSGAMNIVGTSSAVGGKGNKPGSALIGKQGNKGKVVHTVEDALGYFMRERTLRLTDQENAEMRSSAVVPSASKVMAPMRLAGEDLWVPKNLLAEQGKPGFVDFMTNFMCVPAEQMAELQQHPVASAVKGCLTKLLGKEQDIEDVYEKFALLFQQTFHMSGALEREQKTVTAALDALKKKTDQVEVLETLLKRERERFAVDWRQRDGERIIEAARCNSKEQKYFLSKKFEEAVQQEKEKFDTLTKEIEKDRIQLSKANEQLHRQISNLRTKYVAEKGNNDALAKKAKMIERTCIPLILVYENSITKLAQEISQGNASVQPSLLKDVDTLLNAFSKKLARAVEEKRTLSAETLAKLHSVWDDILKNRNSKLSKRSAKELLDAIFNDSSTESSASTNDNALKPVDWKDVDCDNTELRLPARRYLTKSIESEMQQTPKPPIEVSVLADAPNLDSTHLSRTHDDRPKQLEDQGDLSLNLSDDDDSIKPNAEQDENELTHLSRTHDDRPKQLEDQGDLSMNLSDDDDSIMPNAEQDENELTHLSRTHDDRPKQLEDQGDLSMNLSDDDSIMSNAEQDENELLNPNSCIAEFIYDQESLNQVKDDTIASTAVISDQTPLANLEVNSEQQAMHISTESRNLNIENLNTSITSESLINSNKEGLKNVNAIISTSSPSEQSVRTYEEESKKDNLITSTSGTSDQLVNTTMTELQDDVEVEKAIVGTTKDGLTADRRDINLLKDDLSMTSDEEDVVSDSGDDTDDKIVMTATEDEDVDYGQYSHLYKEEIRKLFASTNFVHQSDCNASEKICQPAISLSTAVASSDEIKEIQANSSQSLAVYAKPINDEKLMDKPVEGGKSSKNNASKASQNKETQGPSTKKLVVEKPLPPPPKVKDVVPSGQKQMNSSVRDRLASKANDIVPVSLGKMCRKKELEQITNSRRGQFGNRPAKVEFKDTIKLVSDPGCAKTQSHFGKPKGSPTKIPSSDGDVEVVDVIAGNSSSKTENKRLLPDAEAGQYFQAPKTRVAHLQKKRPKIERSDSSPERCHPSVSRKRKLKEESHNMPLSKRRSNRSKPPVASGYDSSVPDEIRRKPMLDRVSDSAGVAVEPSKCDMKQGQGSMAATPNQNHPTAGPYTPFYHPYSAMPFFGGPMDPQNPITKLNSEGKEAPQMPGYPPNPYYPYPPPFYPYGGYPYGMPPNNGGNGSGSPTTQPGNKPGNGQGTDVPAVHPHPHMPWFGYGGYPQGPLSQYGNSPYPPPFANGPFPYGNNPNLPMQSLPGLCPPPTPIYTRDDVEDNKSSVKPLRRRNNAPRVQDTLKNKTPVAEKVTKDLCLSEDTSEDENEFSNVTTGNSLSEAGDDDEEVDESQIQPVKCVPQQSSSRKNLTLNSYPTSTPLSPTMSLMESDRNPTKCSEEGVIYEDTDWDILLAKKNKGNFNLCKLATDFLQELLLKTEVEVKLNFMVYLRNTSVTVAVKDIPDAAFAVSIYELLLINSKSPKSPNDTFLTEMQIKLAEIVRCMKREFPRQFENLPQIIFEYFLTRIIPNVAIKFPNDTVHLEKLARFYGKLCEEYEIKDGAKRLIFEALYRRPPNAFALAHGLLRVNSNFYSYFKFEEYSLKDRAILFCLQQPARFNDALALTKLKSLFVAILHINIPDITFKQFIEMVIQEIKGYETDKLLRESSKILAMLFINHGSLNESIVFLTQELAKITEEWRNQKVNDGVFATFLRALGEMCEGSMDKTDPKLMEQVKNILKNLVESPTVTDYAKEAIHEAVIKIDIKMQRMKKQSQHWKWSYASKIVGRGSDSMNKGPGPKRFSAQQKRIMSNGRKAGSAKKKRKNLKKKSTANAKGSGGEAVRHEQSNPPGNTNSPGWKLGVGAASRI